MKELDQFKCDGPYCPHETSENHYILGDTAINTYFNMFLKAVDAENVGKMNHTTCACEHADELSAKITEALV